MRFWPQSSNWLLLIRARFTAELSVGTVSAVDKFEQRHGPKLPDAQQANAQQVFAEDLTQCADWA